MYQYLQKKENIFGNDIPMHILTLICTFWALKIILLVRKFIGPWKKI